MKTEKVQAWKKIEESSDTCFKQKKYVLPKITIITQQKGWEKPMDKIQSYKVISE